MSACATCDGFFFRDRELVVVGGGDTAMEEATYLTKFASKVTIVHRRDEFRASKMMHDRALGQPEDRGDLGHGGRARSLGEDGASRASTLRDVKTGERRERSRPTACSWRSATTPNTELFRGSARARRRRVPASWTSHGPSTNVPGVFAAGDVTDRIYRQAVTAAGQGCKAAIDAERFLEDDAHAG